MSIFDQKEEGDLPLPTLNPLIKLFGASADRDGKPRWSLYQPTANKYYYIGWLEFECLARFHKFETANALINDVNNTTTLDIDINDIKALLIFLQSHSLLNKNDQEELTPTKQKPLWERIVHGYLFFTIPLFKPQGFLQKTLPIVKPLFNKTFFIIMMMVLLIGVIMTIPRFDEFTHTFLEMFTVKGAILTFITFAGIKIIHEFSHAYTATKYGVEIPHMGAAFIVMYPILYTETSGAWRLKSKSQRIQIGLAGVAAELVLAAIALILWHILPAGTERSIAFSVIAISLIGSLFINLNPLMRFDGYFVLSDALNIENLHARAIALARWRLRKTLFNLKDPAPDAFPPSLQKFMQFFGFAIIIYRFFLFLGIALLVYTVFFKPLGLALMLLELLWFIGLPILSELKIWWQRKSDIAHQKRSIITVGLTAFIAIIAFLPTQSHITIDGIRHAQNQRDFYTPSAALIETLNIKEGQNIQIGDTLAILKSEKIDQELEILQTALLNLQTQMRREKLNAQRFKEYGANLQDQIEQKQQAIDTLNDKKQRLTIKAPFNGTIRDLSPQIHENRYVSTQNILFTLVGNSDIRISAYIGENDLSRIKTGNSATFRPELSLSSQNKFSVEEIDTLNSKTLKRKELASVYKGNIASNYNENGEIEPLEPVYLINLKPVNNRDTLTSAHNIAQKGKIRIQAEHKSVLLSFFNRLIALIIRETGLN